jgi:hypothetical protein
MSPRGAVAALSILLLSPAAFAQDETEDEQGSEPRLITPTTPDEPEPEPSKDHYKQFGVALQIPAGVRLVAPYDGEYCGDRGGNENANAEVCVGRAPQTLDFVLAYGVKPNFEVMLELRVGVERDFGMSPTSAGTDAAVESDGPPSLHASNVARSSSETSSSSRIGASGFRTIAPIRSTYRLRSSSAVVPSRMSVL